MIPDLVFVVAFVVSPEWQLTQQLRAPKTMTIEHAGRTITVPNLLCEAGMRVTRVERAAGEGTSATRIRFGDLEPLWLWNRAEAGVDLTSDPTTPFESYHILLTPGFYDRVHRLLKPTHPER